MNYKISYLPKNKWENYPLDMEFKTHYFYDFEINDNNDRVDISFILKKSDEELNCPIDCDFPEILYPSYYKNCKAFGVLENDNLIACIQINLEYSNRLRLTTIWVKEDYRRQGIGTQLFKYIEKYALKIKARAIILETQSNNVVSIDFYKKMGFEINGFDKSCYSNFDKEKKNIRLELVYYLN